MRRDAAFEVIRKTVGRYRAGLIEESLIKSRGLRLVSQIDREHSCELPGAPHSKCGEDAVCEQLREAYRIAAIVGGYCELP